ncbi:Mycothiol acetyltransferase [Pandoraea morbifera]|uniref:Mycothiol acetyltransferase n=1 Tax=Pandoraea morbifera TaxID=2508300 RepID=A0A5E4X6Y3_9BURK|nr:GNAT family N-acetyltransferase [Pandoraea morbifera]VVE31988.1 Mycothiol acetyltransferase [Pandoraea morbifera]
MPEPSVRTDSQTGSSGGSVTDEIRELLFDENVRRGGKFIPGDFDAYVEKIHRHAEFFRHYRNGKCDAFIAFYCNDPDAKRAFITLVLTAPSARGSKVGAGLVAAAVATAQARGFSSVELEVDVENAPAVALYKKSGFDVLRETAGRYVMKRSLDSSANDDGPLRR